MIFTFSTQIFPMNVIWSLCLQIQCVCETGAAAGLFIWAERWMGCGAFDLLPVRLWTVPRGEALLWGKRAFISCWQGTMGRTLNAPCSRRCGARRPARPEMPKFLHTESNVDIKGPQCFNHTGLTSLDGWRISQSLETWDWFWKSQPCEVFDFEVSTTGCVYIFFTLYLWTFQSCWFVGGEYFWWYVRYVLSSVHMALFALAGSRAKLFPPRTHTDGDLCCW